MSNSQNEQKKRYKLKQQSANNHAHVLSEIFQKLSKIMHVPIKLIERRYSIVCGYCIGK